MRYPLTEPFTSGFLDGGDGHSIWFEAAGNPTGKPAVLLHGGPGSGSRPGARTRFDPERYLIVQFDQRGAGRSSPPFTDAGSDLSTNTTAHLVGDLETLREHLGIERWLVYGASWGATLAQAYLRSHADRVTEAILVAVTMTRPSEVEWFTRGAGRFFPLQWSEFRDGVPAADRDGNLASAYARLLASPDPEVRAKAARKWCDWEQALLSLEAGGAAVAERFTDAKYRFGFARAVTHYFGNAAWFEEQELLESARRLGHVPAVLIHGRLDLGSPLVTAWELNEAWPGSELIVVDGDGHMGDALGEEVARAADRFA